MPTTHYLWDIESDSYLMEKEETGATTAVYTNEPALYGKLVSQRRGDSTSYYHFDGIASTRQLTDQADNIVESATYSAFGEGVENTSAVINPFGFRGALGYYTDFGGNAFDVLGIVYRPQLGRWLSIDQATFMYAMTVDINNSRHSHSDVIASNPSGADDSASTSQFSLVSVVPPPIDYRCRALNVDRIMLQDLPCKKGGEKFKTPNGNLYCVYCWGSCSPRHGSKIPKNPFPPPDDEKIYPGYCYDLACLPSLVTGPLGRQRVGCSCKWLGTL